MLVYTVEVYRHYHSQLTLTVSYISVARSNKIQCYWCPPFSPYLVAYSLDRLKRQQWKLKHRQNYFKFWIVKQVTITKGGDAELTLKIIDLLHMAHYTAKYQSKVQLKPNKKCLIPKIASTVVKLINCWLLIPSTACSWHMEFLGVYRVGYIAPTYLSLLIEMWRYIIRLVSDPEYWS